VIWGFRFGDKGVRNIRDILWGWRCGILYLGLCEVWTRIVVIVILLTVGVWVELQSRVDATLRHCLAQKTSNFSAIECVDVTKLEEGEKA
jgi:hypothetical protein